MLNMPIVAINQPIGRLIIEKFEMGWEIGLVGVEIGCFLINVNMRINKFTKNADFLKNQDFSAVKSRKITVFCY